MLYVWLCVYPVAFRGTLIFVRLFLEIELEFTRTRPILFTETNKQKKKLEGGPG